MKVSYYFKSILYVLTSNFFSKGILGIISLLIMKYMEYNEYASFVFYSSIVSIISGIFVSSINSIFITGHKVLCLKSSEGCLVNIQIVFIGVTFLFIYYFYSMTIKTILILSFFCFAICLSELIKTHFQQKMDFSKFSLIEITRSMCYLFLISIYLYTEFNLYADLVILLNAIAYVIILLFFIFNNDFFKNFFNITKTIETVTSILSGNFKYLFFYFTLLTLLSQLNVFIIKNYGNEVQLASYGVAFKFYNIFTLILSSIVTVFFPRIQQLQNKVEIENFFKFQQKIVKWMIVFIIVSNMIISNFVQYFFLGKYPFAIESFIILSILAGVSSFFSPYVSIVLRFYDNRCLFICLCFIMFFYLLFCSKIFLNFGIIGLSLLYLISCLFLDLFAYQRAKRLIYLHFK